jgi:hypothetical protein
MHSFWLWAAGVQIVALALWAFLASRRSDVFRVARSIEIETSREVIYPMISDLKIMNTWNEFALRESEAKGYYKGAAQGVGALYGFEGRKSGKGTISITDARAPEALVMRLQMTKPMTCDNRVDFTLVPKDNSTVVTWAMEGRAPFFAKMIQTVVNMDRLVGRDFEAGLKRLKDLAERGRR